MKLALTTFLYRVEGRIGHCGRDLSVARWRSGDAAGVQPRRPSVRSGGRASILPVRQRAGRGPSRPERGAPIRSTGASARDIGQ